jgi:hypothetical protein
VKLYLQCVMTPKLLIACATMQFQASLLAADPGVEGYEFEAILKSVLNGLDAPTSNGLRTSDTHPLVLPNVKYAQFRDFLLAVLGK